MFDSEPADDLKTLEIEFSNLATNLINSIQSIKTYSPLLNLPNEESMQNSSINGERINHENIINYEENKNNINKIIQESSDKINDSFSKIENVIETLKSREEFNGDATKLNADLKALNEINKSKVQEIDKKTKYIQDLISQVERDKQMNENMNQLNNDDNDIFFNENL